jgi:hypothetical protein
MVGHEVERVEVVPLRLDLGALRDLVAHADEQVTDAFHQRRQGMPGAACAPIGRQRHVDRLLGEHPLRRLGSERCVAEVVGALDRLARRVHSGAGVGLGGRRQGADLPPCERDRRSVAEVRRLQRGQRGDVGRARERLVRGGDGVVERRRVE